MTGFTIASGKIIDPSGAAWSGYGINVNHDQGAQQACTADDCTPLLALLPGLSLLRVPFHSWANPSTVTTFVNRVTAKRIPMILEDHTGISAPPYTGSSLASQLAFYRALATEFIANPYVWFGSFNECYANDRSLVSASHGQIYDAIRSTGNTSLIAMCMPGGGNPGTIGAAGGMTPSVYARMKSIVFDLHFYGWVSNYSADQATVNAALQGSAASATGISACQSMTSADGLVPVIIGEYGTSTTGSLPEDANGAQVLAAVQRTGLSSAAWAWRAGGTADNVTDGKTPPALTAFGNQIAAIIKAGAPVTTPIQPGTWQSGTFQGMPYYLLPPPNYDPTRKYGCLLCLHQFEDESAQPGQWDAWINTTAFREDHAVFVLLPLCEINGQKSSDTFNWGGVTADLQAPIVTALALLDSLADKFDPNLLWLAGNSMGALGTWGVLCNPDQRARFAGFLPVAGACYYKVGAEDVVAADLLTTPIWSCHGLADTQVSPQFDINMAAAMAKRGGIERFTGIVGGAHDQWDTFYANPAVWDWLLSQSKGTQPVPASPDWTTITKPSDPPITDAAGATWNILAANNQSIARNGVATVSSNVTLCRIVAGVIYQQNTSGGVWAWQGGGWVSATMPPQPTQPPVTQPPVTQPPSARPALQAKLDQAISLITQVRDALDGPLP